VSKLGFGFLRRSTAYFLVGVGFGFLRRSTFCIHAVVRFFGPFCLARASSLTLFGIVLRQLPRRRFSIVRVKQQAIFRAQF
jgi:hypothetical protein